MSFMSSNGLHLCRVRIEAKDEHGNVQTVALQRYVGMSGAILGLKVYFDATGVTKRHSLS